MFEFKKQAKPGAVSGDALTTEQGVLLLQIEDEMLAASPAQYDRKPSNSAAFKALKASPEAAADMARFIFENRFEIIVPPHPNSWDPETWRGFAVFKALMRGTLPIAAEDMLDWIAAFQAEHDPRSTEPYRQRIALSRWPVAYMLQMIERNAKKTPLNQTALGKLEVMLSWPQFTDTSGFYGADYRKLQTRITGLISSTAGSDQAVVPYKKLSGDTFGNALEAKLALQGDEIAQKWHRLFHLASSATGGKPSKKVEGQITEVKDALGKEWVRARLQDWFIEAVEAKPGEGYDQAEVFTQSNTVLLKGLVWIAIGYQDARTVNLVADLCEKSMKSIAGIGPAAQATANACLLFLERTPGVEATTRLSRLGTAIKQKSVRTRVAEIVADKAQAAGITTIQLEERVVPTYGLEGGVKDIAFDDYRLRIVVDGPGRVAQSWIKPDGSVQKSKPAFVGSNAALKTKYDKLKAEIAVLKKVLTAQRDRIDQMFAEDLTWPLDEVESYYVGHGLVGVIARALIWQLVTDGITTASLWRDGRWEDISGAPVAVTDDTRAAMWHPIDVSTDETMAWRARLETLEIVQPTKQAYREVYLLTDAERQTNVYSNRMAAHILKQHQASTLMAARGWRYQLMGAYDDGLDDQWAHKRFATSDLGAEYLIRTTFDQDWNDAGIYNFIGTDQVRFVRAGAPVALETVPPRLFSETMRDADLFVGVASVGNDPLWVDQGPTPEARDYWQSYAFGALDGFAQTRKDVLETLVPRLKIRDVARIDGKFLIVTGKLNTYKIHLGSANIMMSPGDRYLCIVPGAVEKRPLALPFEGDTRLSVILSKALMLAEDDKITAGDIVSQLKR